MNRLNQLRDALTNTSIVRMIVIVICIVIIAGITAFIIDKLSIIKRKCRSIKNKYKNFPTISSFNEMNNDFKHTLKDYYIKSAYNACSIDDFKNNYVNLCALKQVIRQGYRCLDFAVYSVNNEPVISSSNVKSYDVKYTYNHVPFDAVCETIANQCFNGSGCPNPNDPILIHLRIMSQNSVIYKKMSEIIASRLQQYVLGKKYSYEYDGKNLGDIKLADLQRKVVIMVDKSNPMYEGTDLDEYVNIASNSIFMHALRFDDMRYAPDMQEITEYNKKNMTIVLPNISADSDNYSAALAFKYGCQMAAMSIQTFDSNLDFYNNFFNQAGTAFVLKPIELRHQPINITVPNPPPASHSYASRDLSSDFYSFKI